MLFFKNDRSAYFRRGAVFIGVLVALGVLRSQVEAQPAPSTVPPEVARQMIQGWANSIVAGDLKSIEVYYADPRGVLTWRERLAAARVTRATLLGVHSVEATPSAGLDGTPLEGEARFTIEFWLEGRDRPLNETRRWGLTNKNGFLQIAYEKKEKAPAVLTPAAVAPVASQGVTQQGPFPQLGGGQPAASAGWVEPLPPPTPGPVAPNAVPQPVATPTLNEGVISKKELVDQIWNQLLVKFKKAYEYRSERLYTRLFVKTPTDALEKFREDQKGRGWMQMTRLEIDADSVKGNRLNATFRFRYALWSSGMKRDQIVEVDCAATRGGPGWRFARFGDELLAEPARPAGYIPPPANVRSMFQGPRTSPLGRFFGGRQN